MLQFFEPLHIGGVQPPILGFPLVVRGGADAVLPPDFIDRRPASASFRMATICVSMDFDWGMGTSMARIAIVPESSPFGLSRF